MNSICFLFSLIFLALCITLTNASSCTVMNCDCKGSYGPGMCSQCSGPNCVCDCPAFTTNEFPSKVTLTNLTNIYVEKPVLLSCTINNCNCGNFGDCSSCSGPHCMCSCSAAPLFSVGSGCATGSACQGAGCSTTVGSSVYCCPPGSSSCSISAINGAVQCSCN